MSDMTEVQQSQEFIDIEMLKKSVSPNVAKFCEVYAANGNAVQSLLIAGFAPSSAYGYQARLLSDSRVKALIEYYRAVHADTAAYTGTKLVRQWARQASYSPADLLNDDWTVKMLSDLTEDQREHLRDALVGFEVIEKSGSRTIKPRFARVEAQENLGRLMRLYADDKGSGEGLTLNIHVGQQTTVVGDGEEPGQLHIRLGEADQDGGG